MENRAFLKEEYICNTKLVQLIFLVYVVLVIVQDLALQVPFGTIARSPYIFLSPLIFVFITVLTNKLYFVRGVQYYLIYYTYSLLITIAFILYFVGFKDFGMNLYGENLIIKCIKNSMYNLIIIITLYNYYFIFRFSNLNYVQKLFKVLLYCQVIIGGIQIIVPEAFDFLKTPGLRITERLALLSTEPSVAFPQLVICLLAYLAIKIYNKSPLTFIDYLVTILGFLLLMFIQSRGGIIVLFLTFLLILLFTKQSFTRRVLLLGVSLLFIIPTGWVIYYIVVPQLLSDIENFSSISTRSITILSSLKSLITYPFGQGYGTYLITFSRLLGDTMDSIIKTSPVPLVTTELENMIITGRALTVKSGLLNEVLYTGWGIIILYIFFFTDNYLKLAVLRRNKTTHNIFQFLFLFIIINYLFVAVIETAYIFFLPFALVAGLANKVVEDHRKGLNQAK